MTINLLKVQFSSQYASLKLIAQGGGTIINPVTSTFVTNTNVIPHNAKTDKLIWQVGGRLTDLTNPGILEPGIITPFSTFDGRIGVFANISSSNLTIILTTSTAGSPQDSIQWDYFYRILVP